MRYARFVLNRKNVSRQLLHNAKLMDDVQRQVEGMRDAHPSIEVYRNEDGDRSSVVATAPMSVEIAHGVLSGMLGGVRV